MDVQAFKAANLVGNHPETESLEIVTHPGVGRKFYINYVSLCSVRSDRNWKSKVNREVVHTDAGLVSLSAPKERWRSEDRATVSERVSFEVGSPVHRVSTSMG
jgi:hypothetical protein